MVIAHTPTPYSAAAPHTQGLEITAAGRALLMVLPKVVQTPESDSRLKMTLNKVVDEEVLATGEFIVRACNSHDDLLSALKRLEAFLTKHLRHYAPDAAEPGSPLSQAREAITKAESE